jgi:NADP-dependent 3-hydroxy acid dehydrogenase YdfG
MRVRAPVARPEGVIWGIVHVPGDRAAAGGLAQPSAPTDAVGSGPGMPPAPKIELEGAVVAITGAARGIGRATAEAFARQGATVCLGDLDGDAAALAASEIGSQAHPFRVDVRSVESFEDFLTAAELTAGPLDVLVNNAGVMPAGPFLAETEATTRAVLLVNLAGPLYGMRLVLPGMLERRRGHIVNVASMLGKTELPGLATYVASKHAVVGLSAAVRSELRGSGVTITTLLPSVVNTELSAGIRIPGPLTWLARVEPEDVARAIVESCAQRPKEVAVPRWLGLYPPLRPLIPGWLEDLVRRLIGDDAALRSVDAERRADYEERIAGLRADAESAES